MPFVTGLYVKAYGIGMYAYTASTYCVNNMSASDYGKCYNILSGKAIFVQTDTTTYPTLPCETDGTCTRYTSTAGVRILDTVFSFSGKQAIVQNFWARSHAWAYQLPGNVQYIGPGIIVPSQTGDTSAFPIFPSPNYEVKTWPVYDPVVNLKAYMNPYTITSGNVAVLRWQGTVFTSVLYLSVFESNANNIWYAGDVRLHYAYESSPLAVIPLDYDKEWLPYQELRNVFGYAATGVDQPGWNADDIIRVLRELFPDRAWAVFDDRQYILYLYNLTPDYIPDWLIEKLTPTAMKVLQPPADSTTAKIWLDLLNERNAQIPPQTELP
jgi:hypothetical protein